MKQLEDNIFVATAGPDQAPRVFCNTTGYKNRDSARVEMELVEQTPEGPKYKDPYTEFEYVLKAKV